MSDPNEDPTARPLVHAYEAEDAEVVDLPPDVRAEACKAAQHAWHYGSSRTGRTTDWDAVVDAVTAVVQPDRDQLKAALEAMVFRFGPGSCPSPTGQQALALRNARAVLAGGEQT
jgi:hypothetical protein